MIHKCVCVERQIHLHLRPGWDYGMLNAHSIASIATRPSQKPSESIQLSQNGYSTSWRVYFVKLLVTLGNPFTHLRDKKHPHFGIYGENVHFERFNRCLCTGKHFHSDLDIFRFDFMLTETHDVPPTCSHVSLYVKANHWRHIAWFHKPKIEPK